MSTPEEQREYQRIWRAKRRSDWFAKNGPCVKCGSTEDLELDHIDPATKIHHGIWSWSQKRRDDETAKCQVLCKICHSQKTREDPNQRRSKHGTSSMYDHGCRCEHCRWHKRERNSMRVRTTKKVSQV